LHDAQQNRVMLVVAGPGAQTHLRQLAQRDHWAVLHAPKVGQLLRQIRRAGVDVLVFELQNDQQHQHPQRQEGQEFQDAATYTQSLLVALQNHWRRAFSIVADMDCEPGVEVAMRAAGANCYLPQPNTATVEQAVRDACNGQRNRVGGRPRRPLHETRAQGPVSYSRPPPGVS